MFSLSNTITSYGDRYPEGRTEESNSRSKQIDPRNNVIYKSRHKLVCAPLRARCRRPDRSGQSGPTRQRVTAGTQNAIGRLQLRKQLAYGLWKLSVVADAPDDMRRHPPAQASAAACSAFGPIARVEGEMREVDPAVSGLCEVGHAVTGLCEVDPAVSGLCEVGPAETGLA